MRYSFKNFVFYAKKSLTILGVFFQKFIFIVHNQSFIAKKINLLTRK
jgi:hypothetical protein